MAKKKAKKKGKRKKKLTPVHGPTLKALIAKGMSPQAAMKKAAKMK